ncbi:MAG: hypothetical protein J2P28_10055 [Actinobacteria bacterium]|nr:hypothetical protein [Actinomycetota bacterium]
MIFRRAGSVRVDSGLLLFIDPCYVQSGASQQSTSKTVEAKLAADRSGQLHYPLGHPGLGVVATDLPTGTHDAWIGEEDGRVWRLEIWFGPRRLDLEHHSSLGVCGVDAGQIMVVDPRNLDPHWVDQDDAAVVGVTFWGGDKNLLLDALGDRVEEYQGGIGNHLVSGADGDVIEAEIQALAAKLGASKIVTHVERRSSYEGVCALTRRGAGTLPFPDGTDGWLVAASSGDGDGIYEVSELISQGRVIAVAIDFR